MGDVDRPYRSPFELPPSRVKQCSDRYEAENYPYTHCYSSRCLYHHGRDDRIGKLPPEVDPRWNDWAKYRKQYVAADILGNQKESEELMAQMLECVTLSVPPLAPPEKQVSATQDLMRAITTRPAVAFACFIAIVVFTFLVLLFI